MQLSRREPPKNYAELNVPPPVNGLVVDVQDKGGYDRIVFTTDTHGTTRFVVFAPHVDDRHKSNIHKGHGLVLRRASTEHRFGVASVRAFLETGVDHKKPLSKRQTVRVGLMPFFYDAKDVQTATLTGKVDEIVQWEPGWHSLTIEMGMGIGRISVPEGDLIRDAWVSKEFKDQPKLRVGSRDRVVAFPELDVAFIYPRSGGFRGVSRIKRSPIPAPLPAPL